MSASGSILPIPKWYFVDNNGQPLGAGFLYTRRSLDKTQLKPVFQDPGLTIPYVYTTTSIGPGIRIDANGTTGPIFWAADEPYYIFVTDMLGNLVWDMDGFGPAIAGGGGGGNITTILDIENLIPNNTFYRYGIPGSPLPNPQSITPVPAFLTIAPGGHSGLSGVSAAAGGSPAPDICFIKDTITATDTLSFGEFVPGGAEFSPADVTPAIYLHYESNGAGAETYKYIQFPITSGAQNLSNLSVKGTIWARWNSGSGTTLNLFFRQFFGSGGGSPDNRSTPATINLTTTDNLWHQYTFTLTVPNASGATLGDCGNDGLFFQVEYPLGLSCNIDFVKPTFYLGAVTAPPTMDFVTNDELEALTDDFRTGDIRSSLNSFAPYGWVAMNDSTIGSETSGALNRANRDTFPLYKLLYTSVSNTYAPVSGGRSGSGTTDAEAIADFAAGKTLTLTRMLGRVLGEAGSGSGLTARALGEYLGEENHTLTIAEMPSHNHPGSVVPTGASAGTQSALEGTVPTGSQPITVAAQGGGSAHNTMQPTSFVNMFIKL